MSATYFPTKRHTLVCTGNTPIWCFRKVEFHHSGENLREKLIEKNKLEAYKLNWDSVKKHLQNTYCIPPTQ